MPDLNAWYYRLMGDVVGPVTSKSLRELAKKGGIDFDTQVRKGTDGDWVSAASIKGLFPDEPYVPPQVSTEPPEFAPSAEIHKMPIAPQKPVEPSRNAVDRNLPSSVELLSFNLVRIAMMLFACLAILAAFWFLILLLLNLRPTQSNPADPSIYSTIKARSRADMAEPNMVDIDNKRILEVQPDRTRESVDNLWKTCSETLRSSIKAVASQSIKSTARGFIIFENYRTRLFCCGKLERSPNASTHYDGRRN